MALKIRKIEISHRTIIFAVLFIIFLRFLRSIEPVLVAIFIGYLISTAVYPLVKFLSRFRIPFPISSFLILFSLLIAIFSSFASMLPLVISQTSAFLRNLPNIVAQLGVYNIDASVVTSQFSSLSSSLFRFAIDTFSVALFLLTTFVISFYLILERRHLDVHLDTFFSESQKQKINSLLVEVETRLGYWVRGELFLMLTIGVLTYIALSLIGIDYALPLAIIAGLLELIPNIGPTIAALPAAVVGFATSPFHGMLTVLAALIIQQLENSLIVPSIMKKAVGLPPIITIISLLVGFQIGGPLLAILALPLVILVQVILRYLYLNKKGEVQLVSPTLETK